MLYQISIIIILIIVLLLYNNFNKFDNFNNFDKTLFPDSTFNAYMLDSKQKYDQLTTIINPLSPSIPIDSENAYKVEQATYSLDTDPSYNGFNLIANNTNKFPDDTSTTLKLVKTCEAVNTATCDAFDDPTFAGNCGVSFDINGLNADGKAHLGGLYISSYNRSQQTDKAKEVVEKGIPPYDPYKIYKPSLGKSKPGTFGITKDKCIVVKEKVECEAKQSFNSPNCTQCYSTKDFARVGPETGRNPMTLVIVGNGSVTVEGFITLNSALDANPQSITIPGDSEGHTFTIYVEKGNGKIVFLSGYIQGETPRGPFKLDLINIVQSDMITNVKPKISGTKAINGFRCLSMIPGTGKTSIKISCLIPFSFLNMYDGDALTCENGPVITKAASATFLESNPCYGKQNAPGNYKLQCLQERWINMGGTQEGTGYPNTKEKADAIQKDASGNPLTIDTIVDNLSIVMTKALTGQNNGQNMSIPEWNDVSMYATGVPINTPCDGPGVNTQQCASFLYTNQGAGTHIGQTYTNTMGEGFIDVPYLYERAPLDPETNTGWKTAQPINGIDSLKSNYNDTYEKAHNNNLSNEQRSQAVLDGYGVRLLPSTSLKKPGPTQVFAVGPNYDYNQGEAESVCAKYGAHVATNSQVQEAYSHGADWCFTGWVADGSAKYPITTTVIPGCAWSPQIVDYIPPQNKAGVICYGPKPNIEDVPPDSIKPFNPTSWNDPTTGSGTMLGRYIKLQAKRTDCMNLSQIEVYSKKNGKNIITPNMVVTLSSKYQDDHWNGAQFVNGNRSGDTIVHTSCSDIPWIEVDLGSIQPIYKIVVINRRYYESLHLGRILGIKLSIMDNSRQTVYTSEPIATGNKTYTWFPPAVEVYGDLVSDPLPRQKVYSNNGSVSCETYCRGSGGPWNGELPVEWNGAKCVAVDSTIENCYTGFSISGSPCTCEPTGTGWA